MNIFIVAKVDTDMQIIVDSTYTDQTKAFYRLEELTNDNYEEWEIIPCKIND